MLTHTHESTESFENLVGNIFRTFRSFGIFDSVKVTKAHVESEVNGGRRKLGVAHHHACRNNKVAFECIVHDVGGHEGTLSLVAPPMDPQALSTLLRTLPKQALERGRDYAARGRVSNVQKTGGDEFHAVVHGTEAYRVSVGLLRGSPWSACSCPAHQDSRPCKHVAALAIALDPKRPPPSDRAAFPDLYAARGEEATRVLVRVAREQARAYGFSLKAHVAQYVGLAFVLGARFDVQESLPWASLILRDPAPISAETRIARLLARGMDHLAEQSRGEPS